MKPGTGIAGRTAPPGPLRVSAETEERWGWKTQIVDGVTVRFRGHAHNRKTTDVICEAVSVAQRGTDASASWLNNLNGHFSLVVEGPDWTFAASDPVRSYPLLWARDDTGNVLVGSDGPRLARRLGLGAEHIDAHQAGPFALSGFTIGDATLYPQIRQLGPGTFLFSNSDAAVTIHRYHRWRPWAPDTTGRHDLADTLSSVNRRLIEDLSASSTGRPIVVPLSAGLDSRFIVSGLVEAGYRDVRTFSYGLPGNREAEIARDIARRLGVPWTFLPYTNAGLRQMFHSEGYRAFMAYSDSLTSIHFPQEYFALAGLNRRGWLPDDAIVVNGQTGDFIAGNHIPQSLQTPDMDASKAVRRDRVVTALIEKHFKHWQCLKTTDRLGVIRRMLEQEIDAIGGMPDDQRCDHGIYEYCEFQDRQSKYVINGQRLYEFLGLDWRLPLWERSYLDFWEKAPLEAKIGERLYRQVLVADNWGGVWRDIPVNPTRIRPRWIVPLRHLMKIAHAPLGKSAWHRFEKRYLDYFMATTCAYAFVPYRRVAADTRGHYSAIGWHIEAYLNAKGLAFDGTPARD